MKTFFLVLSVSIVVCILVLFILGRASRSGKPPGLLAGRLAGCPATPNCVGSEQGEDLRHSIDPVQLPQDITVDPLPILQDGVREMGGIIGAEGDHYFAATFSSAIFGFVDDLEVRIDGARKVVHVRSASRVGYGDGGVNRQRVESLKKIFGRKVGEGNHP